MQLLSFILFLAIVTLVIYLPGRMFLRFSGFKYTSFIITFSISLIVGLAAFLFSTYTLSWLKIPFLYNLIIPIALFFEYKKSFKEFKDNLKIKNLLTLEGILVILGTLAMVYTTWGSGVYKNGEMLFYGVNGQDSVYHLALIGSLISSFPPVHPGLSGIPLRGYNFFYDFLIANFSIFYHINPLDLFFRFFPLFISLTLGLASLSLARFLKWKKITTLLFIFLMYFVQSFDFFAFYLYRFFNFYYNSAGITQSFGNALDPSIVVSASFILIGFILLFSKGKKWAILLPILVIGVIPQIKIYAGVIFYLGFLAIAIFELFRKKDIYYSKILVFSGLLSAFVYLPINLGAGGLIFTPLLIYKNFIDSAWIFNNWHWNVNFPIFVQSKNYLHIAYFYAVAIAIFLISSLGVRVLILINVRKIFNKKFYSPGNIFWSACILASFLIPSFFIQSVSGFSIIQFFWVGYIVLLIPTAFVLGEKLEKANKIVLVGAFALLTILFLPDTLRIIKTYSFDYILVNRDITKQTNIISKIPKSDGVLIANRIKVKGKYQEVFSIPMISALSGRPVFYEHELTAFQGIDKITDLRKEIVDKIGENMINCNDPAAAEQNIINIMKKTNNKYLLILKKNECTQKFSELQIVNEEEKSVLYKI